MVKEMNEKHSQIGEFGYRFIPVEGHNNKKGRKILPYWKKVKYEWKHN